MMQSYLHELRKRGDRDSDRDPNCERRLVTAGTRERSTISRFQNDMHQSRTVLKPGHICPVFTY